MTLGPNDTISIDAQRREIAAAKNVARMVAGNGYKASVKALSLMTIGRGGLISALRHVG